MIATPDPERIKAICKRRRQWYMATCIIGPLAVVAYFQQISSGAHGRLPPFAWAALLVSVAAVVLGDLIWRCPACKVAVWSNYAGAGDKVRFLRVGTLDEPDAMPPDIHIFTMSKQPWVVLPQGVPAVPEYYKPREMWPAESQQRFAALKGK